MSKKEIQASAAGVPQALKDIVDCWLDASNTLEAEGITFGHPDYMARMKELARPAFDKFLKGRAGKLES